MSKFSAQKVFKMQKIKKILFKQPLLSLAALCFAIALVSPFVFVDRATDVKQEITKATVTETVTPTKAEENTQSVQGESTYRQTATPTHSASRRSSEEGSGQAVQTVTNTSQQTAQPTATTAPQPTSAPAVHTFQVSLKINGSSVGNVDMQEGNNQCDVLSRAKDQGKISSLLMKYDNNLGTNGVYQINGMGKDNVVWWVYKVNGQSPSQGCSYIKANSGDTVEWEYKG